MQYSSLANYVSSKNLKLQAEKSKQVLYQAKYGRFGLGDPFHAMQRDSDGQKDNSFDEAAVKAMYDNQLLQLENLIDTQRQVQIRMREQLVAVEKRYHKVLILGSMCWSREYGQFEWVAHSLVVYSRQYKLMYMHILCCAAC